MKLRLAGRVMTPTMASPEPSPSPFPAWVRSSEPACGQPRRVERWLAERLAA